MAKGTNVGGNAVTPDVKNVSSKSLLIFNLHEVHLIKIFHKLQDSQIKEKQSKALRMKNQ